MARYVIYEDQRFLDMPAPTNLFHPSSPVIPSEQFLIFNPNGIPLGFLIFKHCSPYFFVSFTFFYCSPFVKLLFAASDGDFKFNMAALII